MTDIVTTFSPRIKGNLRRYLGQVSKTAAIGEKRLKKLSQRGSEFQYRQYQLGARALRRMGTEARKANAHLKNLGATGGRTGVGGLGEALSKLAKTVYTLTAAYIAFRTVARGVNAILGQLDKWKSLENRLVLVTQNTRHLRKTLGNLRDMSIRLRSELETLVILYQRVDRAIEKLGYGAQDTMGVVEAVALAVKTSGTTAHEATGGIRQLTQAFNKGKLDGDEFRSVAENMPVVLDAIADAMSRTYGKLDRTDLFVLAPKGLITVDYIVQGLLKALDKLNPEYEKFQALTQEKAQNFWDAVLGMFGAVDKHVKASDTWNKFMDSLIKSLVKMADELNATRDRIDKTLATDKFMKLGKEADDLYQKIAKLKDELKGLDKASFLGQEIRFEITLKEAQLKDIFKQREKLFQEIYGSTEGRKRDLPEKPTAGELLVRGIAQSIRQAKLDRKLAEELGIGELKAESDQQKEFRNILDKLEKGILSPKIVGELMKEPTGKGAERTKERQQWVRDVFQGLREHLNELIIEGFPDLEAKLKRGRREFSNLTEDFIFHYKKAGQGVFDSEVDQERTLLSLVNRRDKLLLQYQDEIKVDEKLSQAKDELLHQNREEAVTIKANIKHLEKLQRMREGLSGFAGEMIKEFGQFRRDMNIGSAPSSPPSPSPPVREKVSGQQQGAQIGKDMGLQHVKLSVAPQIMGRNRIGRMAEIFERIIETYGKKLGEELLQRTDVIEYLNLYEQWQGSGVVQTMKKLDPKGYKEKIERWREGFERQWGKPPAKAQLKDDGAQAVIQLAHHVEKIPKEWNEGDDEFWEDRKKEDQMRKEYDEKFDKLTLEQRKELSKLNLMVYGQDEIDEFEEAVRKATGYGFIDAISAGFKDLHQYWDRKFDKPEGPDWDSFYEKLKDPAYEKNIIKERWDKINEEFKGYVEDAAKDAAKGGVKEAPKPKSFLELEDAGKIDGLKDAVKGGVKEAVKEEITGPQSKDIGKLQGAIKDGSAEGSAEGIVKGLGGALPSTRGDDHPAKLQRGDDHPAKLQYERIHPGRVVPRSQDFPTYVGPGGRMRKTSYMGAGMGPGDDAQAVIQLAHHIEKIPKEWNEEGDKFWKDLEKEDKMMKEYDEKFDKLTLEQRKEFSKLNLMVYSQDEIDEFEEAVRKATGHGFLDAISAGFKDLHQYWDRKFDKPEGPDWDSFYEKLKDPAYEKNIIKERWDKINEEFKGYVEDAAKDAAKGGVKEAPKPKSFLELEDAGKIDGLKDAVKGGVKEAVKEEITGPQPKSFLEEDAGKIDKLKDAVKGGVKEAIKEEITGPQSKDIGKLQGAIKDGSAEGSAEGIVKGLGGAPPSNRFKQNLEGDTVFAGNVKSPPTTLRGKIETPGYSITQQDINKAYGLDSRGKIPDLARSDLSDEKKLERVSEMREFLKGRQDWLADFAEENKEQLTMNDELYGKFRQLSDSTDSLTDDFEKLEEELKKSVEFWNWLKGLGRQLMSTAWDASRDQFVEYEEKVGGRKFKMGAGGGPAGKTGSQFFQSISEGKGAKEAAMDAAVVAANEQIKMIMNNAPEFEKSMGKFLRVLNEGFAIVATFVIPILEGLAPLLDAISTIFAALMDTLKGLEPVFKLLGEVIRVVAEAIRFIVDGMMFTFQKLDESVGGGTRAFSGAAVGAGVGALVGTFLLPGVGTAAGAAIGAGIGGGIGATQKAGNRTSKDLKSIPTKKEDDILKKIEQNTRPEENLALLKAIHESMVRDYEEELRLRAQASRDVHRVREVGTISESIERGQTTGASPNITIINVDDASRVAEHMSGKKGEEVVMNHLYKNGPESGQVVSD